MRVIEQVRQIAAALMFVVPLSAHAVFIGNAQGGTDFPQGAVSFADAVVSFAPGMVGSNPTTENLGATNALGLPNYASGSACTSQANCPHVSLGDGGVLVLQFVDNRLTGSGNSAFDLWVFEVGPDVEDTYVDISKDGSTWSSVGKVFGSTAGVDIDAYGFGIDDLFAYIRLTDDTNEGEQTGGASIGADIDAVGAISTVRSEVPEPATMALLGAGLIGLSLLRRKTG